MLYNELKTETIDSTKPLSDVLRKTMVLSYKLKNDELKTWIRNELDGYNGSSELPHYRIFCHILPPLRYGKTSLTPETLYAIQIFCNISLTHTIFVYILIP